MSLGEIENLLTCILVVKHNMSNYQKLLFQYLTVLTWLMKCEYYQDISKIPNAYKTRLAVLSFIGMAVV